MSLPLFLASSYTHTHSHNYKVNVYSVGLYLESSSLSKLKAYKGKDTQTLTKDKSYYQTLLKPGMGRALHLVFARSVGAEKV